MTENKLIDSLKDPDKKIDGIKIFYFLKESESSNFYNKQFQSNSEEIKKTNVDFSSVPDEMKDAMDFFKSKLNNNALIVELGGGRFQRRSGYPCYIFENYVPLDISFSSIRGYVDLYDKFGIVADASKLPFKDKTVDAIFTHTFLEHPLDPESVINEIDRVLKPGGYVVHSDAWNCRWWQRYGLVGVKKFGNMIIKEKIIYFLAKITEFKLIRMSIIISKRIFSLIIKTRNLKYKKLKPNYNLHLYKDEDAASSIDPVNLMLFYEKKSYELIPKLNLLNKIFFRSQNIYLQKKN